MVKYRIDILPSAYISAAVLLLIFPLRWIFAWITAAAIHETGHIITVLILGGRIERLKIGASGASIVIPPMTPLREMLCALAGPASGLFLVLFIRWIPMIALFALLQSVYNLLPIYPLDGGRALRCALVILTGEYRAERTLRILEMILFAILAVIGILAFFLWNLGILPLLVILVLLVQSRMRKIPCKRRYLGLQ